MIKYNQFLEKKINEWISQILELKLVKFSNFKYFISLKIQVYNLLYNKFLHHLLNHTIQI
jgi:hypothetical protein